MYRNQLHLNILKYPLAQTIHIQIIKAGFVVKLNFLQSCEFQGLEESLRSGPLSCELRVVSCELSASRFSGVASFRSICKTYRIHPFDIHDSIFIIFS